MRLVAVTACPTGIAHTYMAAEALEQAAKDAGHQITVETQGAAGAVPLTADQIAAADAVIFAVDVEVRGRDRFAGKPTVEVPVKKAISGSPELLARAEEAIRQAGTANAATGVASGSAAAPVSAPAPSDHGSSAARFGTHLRQWMMTGVSYMIPFVAAGGILIALAFMFGGAEVAMKVNGGVFQGHTYPGVTDLSKLISQAGFAGVLFKIGATAFSMLVPILAGFIAYAMADRQGLVPGIVSGLLASAIGAGFLGGLVGGLLAGALVLGLTRFKPPRAIAGIMPVVVVPLVSTLIMGVLMLVVIGEPIAAAQRGLTNWLGGLTGTNAILLGALLGLMMAFDLGGPVNKVAYTFGVGSLASGELKVMAAVMAAGMVPPIAMALSTVVRPKLFGESERKAGEAAWLLGASFITEGAIPFAAADPLRVLPSLMVGSATTGALSMAFGATSRAPHGGLWVIGLIGRPGLYLLAIAAGVLVAAACVIGAKQIGRSDVADEATDAAEVAASDAKPVVNHEALVG
ncbi:PTS system D-fructose-specific IIB component (F1P-forming) (Frc family) /PTS system D-fructose-specific IIC component (F1P-forming) (Frc family) [Streptomyces sp. 846.5]|nr:PTS system D-fructose-specific IIB component (F1P-forming) (Frc family) /PTS system D-fructose-specific IIC component (F1P-forming) (Frc family) [Streptomyces sp. 846.5]